MEKLRERFGGSFTLRCVCLVCTLSVILVWSAALAQEGISSSEKLRQDFVRSTKGKTIAFVPALVGAPVCDIMAYVIAKEAKEAGMKVLLRDPAMIATRQTQAVAALISQKPDVLVVHNLNVQLLVELLKKAEKAGIYVIQANMVSNYKSDAFVGADFTSLGEMKAEEIIRECGAGSGRSGKVAIMQGEMTSGTCIEMTKAILSVFKKHPEIKVVSNQGAAWDANKAYDIASLVLKQHPDLCAMVGYWTNQDLGAGRAVEEAGLKGKVRVYSSAELTPPVCQAIRDGLITAVFDYQIFLIGHDIISAAKNLLQVGRPPGSSRVAYYTPVIKVTKENVDSFNCWIPSAEMVKEMYK